jgi:hypothetical protein
MSAPKPAPTMANVFDDDGRYLGCVFARGVAGFEAFDPDDKSLGIFEIQREAATAVMRKERDILKRYSHEGR